MHANARKTHCKRGHPYEGENLYLYDNGLRRHCRRCRALAEAERRAAKRQTAAAGKHVQDAA